MPEENEIMEEKVPVEDKKVRTFDTGQLKFRGKIGDAIQMYVMGYNMTEIANSIGVNANTVRGWMKREDVKEEVVRQKEIYDNEFREEIKNRSKKLYEKALGVMSGQLDSENEWIQQNAARDLLTRFQADITGAEANTVTVHVVGMPEIGESTGKEDA